MKMEMGVKLSGMTRTENGDFILSTSYGLSKSHLLVYRNEVGSPEDVDRPKLDIDGTSVTVWFLDESNLIRDVVAPPMSEEMGGNAPLGIPLPEVR